MLTIVLWKAGAIQPHAAQLKLYTEEMEPDVVCIQVKWLRNSKLETKGYTISRTNQEPTEKEEGRSSLKGTSHMKEFLSIPHKTEDVSNEIRTFGTRNQHHNSLPSTSGTHWFQNYQTNTCLQKYHYMRRHGCQEHSLGSCQERPSRQTNEWSGWLTQPHCAEHRKRHTPQHIRLTHPSWCRPRQRQPLVIMWLEDHRRWWVGKWPPLNPRHLQRTTEHGGDPLINTTMFYSSDAFAGLRPMWQQRRSIVGGRTYPGLPRVEESVELWRTDGRRSTSRPRSVIASIDFHSWRGVELSPSISIRQNASHPT